MVPESSPKGALGSEGLFLLHADKQLTFCCVHPSPGSKGSWRTLLPCLPLDAGVLGPRLGLSDPQQGGHQPELF